MLLCCLLYFATGKVRIGEPEMDASAVLLSVFENLATL